MQKFRKKPVVIEAVQFTGDIVNAKKIVEWAGFESKYFISDFVKELNIHTLEGVMTAGVGDWIIKGVMGEFYPCKDDVFKATYEAVSNPSVSEIKGRKIDY